MEGEAFTTRVAKPREMTLNTPYMHAHMRMPMHVSIFSLNFLDTFFYLSWPSSNQLASLVALFIPAHAARRAGRIREFTE